MCFVQGAGLLVGKSREIKRRIPPFWGGRGTTRNQLSWFLLGIAFEAARKRVASGSFPWSRLAWGMRVSQKITDVLLLPLQTCCLQHNSYLRTILGCLLKEVDVAQGTNPHH